MKVSYFAVACLAASYMFACSAFTLSGRRRADFGEQGKYELFHFDLAAFETDSVIELTAFGMTMKLALELNENINPLVRRFTTEGVIIEAPSADKKCYYRGTVMNVAGRSSVRMSICKGRGVRGHIKVSGETFIVEASAAFFNPKSKDVDHHMSHEHIIYRESDFEEGKSAALKTVASLDEDADADADAGFKESLLAQLRSVFTRRRLAYNSGQQNVEIYFAAGKSSVDTYDCDGATDILSTIVNGAEELYADADWDEYAEETIGSVALSVKQVDCQEDYSGSMRNLRCDDCSRSSWLDTWEEWALDNTNLDEYDYGFLWLNPDGYTSSNSWSVSGYSAIRGLCSERQFGVALGLWDKGSHIRLFAHELGHCYGMFHDEDGASDSERYDCSDDPGYMADGDGEHFWTSCSQKYMADYYVLGDGLSCLSSDGSTSAGPGPAPAPTPTPPPVSAPIDISGDEIFYDSMSDVSDWEISSSTHVSTSSSSTYCTSSGCVKIAGYDGEDCSITRSTSNVYSSYTVKLDVTLDDMESNNFCVVSVQFDNNGWTEVASFEGSATQTETLEQQVMTFDTVSSASTLYVKLSTDADSSSGGDVCYYDNVYVYGSGSNEPDPTRQPTSKPVVTPAPVSSNPGNGNGNGNGCVTVNLESENNANGDYEQVTTKNGWPAYYSSEHELFLVAVIWDGVAYYLLEENLNDESWSKGYCKNTDSSILDCDGQWRSYITDGTEAGSTFTDCSTSSSGSAPTPPPVSSSSNTDNECVSIRSLSGRNGEYVESGSNEGYPAYHNSEDGLWLYNVRDPSDGLLWWTINPDKGVVPDSWSEYGYCDDSNLDDVNECDGNWLDTSRDSNCQFYPCLPNALLSEEPCLVNNPFGDTMCFYQNATSATEEPYLFAVNAEEGCVRDYPVYKHSLVDVGVEKEYFLHLSLFGKWVISVNGIFNDGIYQCEQASLLECTAGHWKALTTDGDADGYDLDVNIKIEACDSNLSAQDDGRRSDTEDILIVLVVLVVLGLCCVAGFCMYRSRKVKKEVSFNHANREDVEAEAAAPMTTR
eukprot:CAMPEP_0202691016 /NCGR_PEP_ID=MMETSP1385-20130828/5854_1 /ASSEMBLY_ACC=CAM_ASM_000861 /TAXON_ID=933848 /ORGANISM="Elphidium margaritaceum" /LENGTH=1048 /DNA_ID=CAMNT_0049346357 /DNA_START=86 /DNA_END=3232 /DNA_ORIENTATION=+